MGVLNLSSDCVSTGKSPELPDCCQHFGQQEMNLDKTFSLWLLYGLLKAGLHHSRDNEARTEVKCKRLL